MPSPRHRKKCVNFLRKWTALPSGLIQSSPSSDAEPSTATLKCLSGPLWVPFSSRVSPRLFLNPSASQDASSIKGPPVTRLPWPGILSAYRRKVVPKTGHRRHGRTDRTIDALVFFFCVDDEVHFYVSPSSRSAHTNARAYAISLFLFPHHSTPIASRILLFSLVGVIGVVGVVSV